jgi:hypothetical protein
MSKPKKRLTKFEEAGSVRFDKVGDVEFWLTAINRVFLLMPGGKVVFPSLQGSVLRYDEPNFKAEPEVEAKLTDKLRKQREIRMEHWVNPEEEELAWQYN